LVKAVKTEAQKKKKAREKAARALERTKRRLGLDLSRPLGGALPSPLEGRPWVRKSKLPPTSDRIPGSAPAKDLLHVHKWKKGAEETEATKGEMRRKATQIAPAYNKGALQYLPYEGKKKAED
jgi:hypothetical protein